MLARVGPLDANQSPVAIDVAPAERTELAEPKPGPERDIEEADEEEVWLATEGIERRELEERAPDSIRVRRRDLFPGEVLRRWQVGSRGRIGD